MDKNNRSFLEKITISGFKSISPENPPLEIHFDDITILIGANGAGKSNMISFFHMLNRMMTRSFQSYVLEYGDANLLLYYGKKKTERIKADIQFGNSQFINNYIFTLAPTGSDTLIFTEETIRWKNKSQENWHTKLLGEGHKESEFGKMKPEKKESLVAVMYKILSNCRVFQFHDTSKESHIKNPCRIDDNRFLKHNGGNLAAYLYMLKNRHEKYYDRIVNRVRMIMPQFGDFELYPSVTNQEFIKLNWKGRDDDDYLFNVHQLSDGSLRFIALTTLLLQPPEFLPNIIVIDEPELGLHPKAIAILAGMIQEASEQAQIVVATQSPRIVDEFSIEKIRIVERNEKEKRTVVKELQEDELKEWLENYSTSELWEKNIIGGQP